MSRDKELDLAVVSLLQSHGIFNQIQAQCCADVAELVTEAGISPEIQVPTNDDHRYAQQLVRKYLIRHQMMETLRCIAAEAQFPGDSAATDDISSLCAFFRKKVDSPIPLTKSQRQENRQSIRASPWFLDPLDTPTLLNKRKQSRLRGLKPKGVDEFESDNLDASTINDSDGLGGEPGLWSSFSRSSFRRF